VSQPDQKACPILARQSENGLELLAFRHPFAGTQLVKGSIEHDERPQDAAARELLEESGVAAQGAPLSLGTSNGIVPRETWNFFLFPCPPLADEWQHHCPDDGGHDFKFFWQPVEEYLEGDWPAPFIRALRFAVGKIEKLSPQQRDQYCETQQPEIARTIRKLVDKIEDGRPMDPSAVAVSIAGKDEKKWRKLMPLIKSEAVKLALNGEIQVLRKGKPVSSADFKGLYKIAALSE
jgi:8-oxo-dGTP pyrophosphatase MutT (NUDIX family)